MPKPTGPQFTRVYHSSFSPFPPHEFDPKEELDDPKQYPESYGNSHIDVIHAGTENASSGVGRFRKYTHMYDVPSHSMYPVTFGDEDEFLNEQSFDQERAKIFNSSMKGAQPGLFEETSAEPEFALKTNKVIPYRNRVEDPGSISYMIPKNAINPKGVIYVGKKEK